MSGIGGGRIGESGAAAWRRCATSETKDVGMGWVVACLFTCRGVFHFEAKEQQQQQRCHCVLPQAVSVDEPFPPASYAPHSQHMAFMRFICTHSQLRSQQCKLSQPQLTSHREVLSVHPCCQQKFADMEEGQGCHKCWQLPPHAIYNWEGSCAEGSLTRSEAQDRWRCAPSCCVRVVPPGEHGFSATDADHRFRSYHTSQSRVTTKLGSSVLNLRG